MELQWVNDNIMESIPIIVLWCQPSVIVCYSHYFDCRNTFQLLVPVSM